MRDWSVGFSEQLIDAPTRSSVPCRVRRLQLLKQLLTVLVPRDQNRGQQSQPKHIHQTETRPPLSAFWRRWLFRRIDKIIKANQPLPNRSMNYFESEKRLNRRSLSGQFRKDFLCPIPANFVFVDANGYETWYTTRPT